MISVLIVSLLLTCLYLITKNNQRHIKLLKYRIITQFTRRTLIHFLHIGKTAGTAVKYALKTNCNPYIDQNYIILLHNHTFKLQDAKKGEKVFFTVRDPVDRFISGFYSRKRKGMPRIYNEWNSGEKKAFRTFKTANDLALSLTSSEISLKEKAEDAMRSIDHIRRSYWNWFGSKEYLLSRKDDIIFIGDQSRLNEDFKKLKEKLNLSDTVNLPSDKVKMHKNPENTNKKLEDVSIDNLQKWFQKDYEFLEVIKGFNL